MAKPKNTVWDLDPHTRAKHVILRKYLDAWLPIISRYKGRVLFFDGFAGPGIYSNGEDGSPVIALKALIEHAHKGLIKAEVNFLFIEADKERAERLQQVVGSLLPMLPANANVLVRHDEYAQTVSQVLDELEHSSQRLAPSLVFVDPFGVSGVPMKLIRRVMAMPSCEVLINFMVSYMNRFIAAPEFETHLDDIFGCTGWRICLDRCFRKNLFIGAKWRSESDARHFVSLSGLYWLMRRIPLRALRLRRLRAA